MVNTALAATHRLTALQSRDGCPFHTRCASPPQPRQLPTCCACALAADLCRFGLGLHHIKTCSTALVLACRLRAEWCPSARCCCVVVVCWGCDCSQGGHQRWLLPVWPAPPPRACCATAWITRWCCCCQALREGLWLLLRLQLPCAACSGFSVLLVLQLVLLQVEQQTTVCVLVMGGNVLLVCVQLAEPAAHLTKQGTKHPCGWVVCIACLGVVYRGECPPRSVGQHVKSWQAVRCFSSCSTGYSVRLQHHTTATRVAFAQFKLGDLRGVLRGSAGCAQEALKPKGLQGLRAACPGLQLNEICRSHNSNGPSLLLRSAPAHPVCAVCLHMLPHHAKRNAAHMTCTDTNQPCRQKH